MEPSQPERLAMDGGAPVRRTLLPYGRQTIDDDDVAAVARVLRSDWLTTGPAVAEFERAFASATGAAHAVAVSTGTAALHAALHALDVGPGDEVIVPALTFAATANAALYVGATPVVADVEPDTLLLDPASVAARITPRTRAIIGVDYAGQPADYDALRRLAAPRRIDLVADACHAVGGASRGKRVGTLADLSTFSFHPVKHIATGEGGMVTCEGAALAERMRIFRNHGITTDHAQRARTGAYAYEMVALGNNYRLSDIHAALGTSQLSKLPGSVARRRALARIYDEAFRGDDIVTPLATRPHLEHAYHLYVVRLALEKLRVDRRAVHAALRAEGIGANVHYPPVHLHPYYREKLGTKPGLCPVAEEAAERILTLPLFPAMSDEDAEDTIRAVRKVTHAYRR